MWMTDIKEAACHDSSTHLSSICVSTQQPYHQVFFLFPLFHASKTDLIFRRQWSGTAPFVKIQSTYVCFVFFPPLFWLQGEAILS